MQDIADVSVLEGFGFKVTRRDPAVHGDMMPLAVVGPRGAHYGLMRNKHNPDLLFVAGHARAKIKGWTWFKVVGGKITTWQ